MRVIVGRQARRTPFFAGEITSIRLNPTWTVPERIAVEDKLPVILDDRDFLKEHGFRVFAPAGEAWREIDPAEVDWTRLSEKHFPYRLRQDPGPENALGRIKFQIPNLHDIYLHDTPSRGLFARAERGFSSGCIRVEHPVDLALAPARRRPGLDAHAHRGGHRGRRDRRASGFPSRCRSTCSPGPPGSTATARCSSATTSTGATPRSSRPSRGRSAESAPGKIRWRDRRPDGYHVENVCASAPPAGTAPGDSRAPGAPALSRRSLPRVGSLGASAAVLLPAVAAAARRPPPAVRRLSLHNLHTASA